MNYALLISGLSAIQHPDYPMFGSPAQPSSLTSRLKALLSKLINH